MGAGPEHFRALGLTYWRRRDAPPPEAEPASVQAEATPVPAPLPVQTPSAAPMPPPAPVVAEPQAKAVDDAARTARILAMDWDELEGYVRAQSRESATQAVFGVGPREADLMIIGEAPGADEDRIGEPFVGRAGQLLDRMLQAIDRDRRRNVYIANICKFRPPNNRDPHADEIAEDWPYLRRQIQLLQPRLVLAVGRIAAQQLLGSTQPIGRLRGQVHTMKDEPVPVVVTYHPAYLLRSPREKAKSWADLKLARARLADAE